ncbi:MAG: CDP-alcohol phosphatidyltransferase family protein, partial [Propionibacteriaceae bacterium]|nr:CDP-alcohol phosphatidyltransferase family protein [Propionibacteriaceae bacterium]
GLYWWAGWLYLTQTYRLVRGSQRVDKPAKIAAPRA